MCSLLWEYKDCKPSLKKVGWDLNQYSRISKDPDTRFEFEGLGSSISRDNHASHRKKARGGKHGGSGSSSSSSSRKKKSGKKRKEGAESGKAAPLSTNQIILASQVRVST